jgi:hypothetical protein
MGLALLSLGIPCCRRAIAPSVETSTRTSSNCRQSGPPGINNWDVAIFKSFPIREAMRVQFRAVLYNAFNHTQFSALDTTASFDAQGRQVNTRFGEFTAARNARIIQMAPRFYFRGRRHGNNRDFVRGIGAAEATQPIPEIPMVLESFMMTVSTERWWL